MKTISILALSVLLLQGCAPAFADDSCKGKGPTAVIQVKPQNRGFVSVKKRLPARR